MGRQVNAVDAARNLPELLDRVQQGGETFVILRGGEPVGQLAPVEPAKPMTLRTFFETVRAAGTPDERFARDLEAIQAEQLPAGEPPWHS